MAATVLEAALALRKSAVSLRGDIIVAFAGGGMPINASQRGNRGLSDGVYHMLTRGVCADFAIVMKPGTGVYHEEPGLCWFRVAVRGQFGYAGIPRGVMPNSIPPAAKLILEIEEWLPAYTAKNTRGQVTPRGAITALRAGSVDRLAFTPATTEIYLDIRCAPHTPPAEVKAQFAEAMEAIRARNPEIKFDWDMCAAYPGSATPADNWIIQSAIRGWEAVEGNTHSTPPNSGQTDISLIRNLGIPTARLGWPSTPKNVPPDLTGGLGGMGVAYVPDLAVACRKIIYAAIDTCSRTRSEVKL
jgi:acetylornithine deacetylase/succinyl-diaminopimelate desuccinylase-like protein